MIGRGLGILLQVAMKLRELEMDDRLLRVRSYQGAPEALDGFSQAAAVMVPSHQQTRWGKGVRQHSSGHNAP